MWPPRRTENGKRRTERPCGATGGAEFREDAKGRKGLGTSPFGPSGLSNVPIPCVSAGAEGWCGGAKWPRGWARGLWLR